MKKIMCAVLFAATALTAWAAQAQEPPQDALPAGVVQRGTLADPRLRHDALMGALATVSAWGCNKPETMAPYMLALPTGEVGQREWQERWMINGCGRQYAVDIRFHESGPSKGTDWTILNKLNP